MYYNHFTTVDADVSSADQDSTVLMLLFIWDLWEADNLHSDCRLNRHNTII